MSSKVLSAAEILGKSDQTIVRVEVPEWNGHVHIRTITAEERDKFDADQWDDDGKLNRDLWRVRLVVLATCDAEGKPLFAAGDAARLATRSGPAIVRIHEAISRLNLLRPADLDREKKG